MKKRAGPPLRITMLLVLVLIITVLSAIRLLAAIAWRSAMAPYLPGSLIFYVGVSGAFWTIAGCFVLWRLVRRGRYTRAIVLAAAGGYGAWGWADRLLVQGGAHANWLFALLGTILLLTYVAVVVLDPRNLPYFTRESYGRKPENPAST